MKILSKKRYEGVTVIKTVDSDGDKAERWCFTHPQAIWSDPHSRVSTYTGYVGERSWEILGLDDGLVSMPDSGRAFFIETWDPESGVDIQACREGYDFIDRLIGVLHEEGIKVSDEMFAEMIGAKNERKDKAK